MADLNALIAQGAQFHAPADPFAQYAKMQQLQQGQQANMLNQMKMDEYQQSVQRANALRASPAPAGVSAAHWAIDPAKALEIAKEQATAAAQSATATHKKAQTVVEGQKWMDQAKRDLAFNPSPENIKAYAQDAVLHGFMTVEQATATADQLLKMPPDQLRQVLTASGATAGELKPTIKEQTLGGTVRAVSVPAFGGTATVVPGSEGTVTMTPYQTEQLKVSQGQLKVSQGQLKVAQDRLAKEGAQLDPLENQILSQAIAEGRVDINKINGRNAKIYVGALQATPGIDLREMSFENVASAAGARSLGVQSAKMRTAAIEADKMIDIVRNTSAAIDRTQFPTINAIQNAVDKGTGGKEIVQLNTAINSLVNSYARAISPTGQPTVSDKNHAREVINSAYSNGQIEAITDIMRQEMTIAKESTAEAGSAAKDARKKTPPAPAKTPSGATVSNW